MQGMAIRKTDPAQGSSGDVHPAESRSYGVTILLTFCALASVAMYILLRRGLRIDLVVKLSPAALVAYISIL